MTHMPPPIFVTPIDPAILLQELKADYEARTGRVLQPAQVEMLLLNTIAYRESLLRLAIQDTGEQNLVDFARAPALDYLGALVGVERLPAEAATTELEFSLVNGHLGVTIPALTRVASTDGRAVFRTIEAVSVPMGTYTVTVEAECESLGTTGNGYAAGDVSELMDPQAFITGVENTGTTGGGADQEDDDALRERIKLAPEAFTTAGSRGAYEFHARQANPSIIDVAVVGHSDDPGIPQGEVHIFPLMEDGTTTPPTVLDEVEAACSAETVRPLSDTVVVIAPTEIAYDIEVELTLYTDADGATVQDAVEQAIQTWATGKRQKLGRDIVGTQIIQAVHNAAPDDIYEVTLISWLDIDVASTEYAALDGLMVSIAGYTNG